MSRALTRADCSAGPWPGLTDAELDRTPYAQRVRQLEREGMTTSDAQGRADYELMTGAWCAWRVEA